MVIYKHELLTVEVSCPFPSRLVPHFSLMKETKSSKSLPPPYSSPSLLLFGKNFNVGNPLTPYLDIQQRHSFLQVRNVENASFTDKQAH